MSKRQISPSPDQIPRDIFSNESDMGGPNRTDSPNTRSMLSYTARLVGKPEIYHKAVYPPQNSKRREKSRNKQRTKKALTKILKKSKADAKTKELIKIEIQKMLRNESAPKDIHNPDDLFSLKELEEDEEKLKGGRKSRKTRKMRGGAPEIIDSENKLVANARYQIISRSNSSSVILDTRDMELVRPYLVDDNLKKQFIVQAL